MEELRLIVTAAQAGDLEAYGEIIRRFQNMAYGLAYSAIGDFHLAEDVAAEAFFQAYRDLSKLRKPAAFAGWFRRIVLKHCDRLTRKRRVSTVSLEAASEAASRQPGPAEAAESKEMKDRVLEAIRALPQKQRTATTLFYINGYSLNDIADFLETPVGTVKRRLHDARKQLKERMMTMVENTLKDNALPESFADRLMAFPFPRTSPPVEITDRTGEKMTVRCTDAQAFFVPLVEHGACDWCFYDWPGGRLTGVYEYRVVGASERGKQMLLRAWNRYTDIRSEGSQEWEEAHFLVENDTYRRVNVQREKAGTLLVGEFRFPAEPDEPFKPEPMNLAVGTKWGQHDRNRVVGVSDVAIGDRSWKCLKVLFPAQHSRTDDGSPAVLAEWYVAEMGRTVFFRRYNGRGFKKPESPISFESLAGNLEVEFEGKVFRHFYDCIPDIALEKAFG